MLNPFWYQSFTHIVLNPKIDFSNSLLETSRNPIFSTSFICLNLQRISEDLQYVQPKLTQGAEICFY